MKKSTSNFICLCLLITSCMPALAQSYVPEKQNPLVVIKPAVPVQVYAFPLQDVRINGGLFGKAMELEAAHLLSLKPDRFLYRFRLNAGLAPKDSIYGGWETRGVSGHSLGHYLSACALMYASSGDEKFRQRTTYIVDELLLCQQKRKTGYVGGIPDEDSIFAKVKRGDINTEGFGLNGGWVPWYTIHKVLAGLEDTWLYTHNQKALTILTGFAQWIDNTTSRLNAAQWQQMLAAEHGGMNEVLANLYAFTGNKKYLALAKKFYHKAVLDALVSEKDELAGKHANTQIPKVIGLSRLYELSGDTADKTAALFFWNTVVHHHSYVIGGNSNYEHFTAADKLNDYLSTNTTETCNTYNMLKLTRHLFSWEPQAAYMDYYERALYNHILASQNSDGMVCYYVPLQAGTQKQFSTPFESFWCCTGTGMENHVKYGEQVYAEGSDGSLYVNLFIPSVLNWKRNKMHVTQETSFPENGRTTFTIQAAKATTFTLHLRRPVWARGKVLLSINNKNQEVDAAPGSWINIKRAWKNGDKISIELPMDIYTQGMPDNKERIAYLYGPLVLAAKLPAKSPDPLYDVPVLVTSSNNAAQSVQQQNNQLVFSSVQSFRPYEVTLVPFYSIKKERQAVYFDVYTDQQWMQHKAAFEEEKRKKLSIEKRTVDLLRIGEMQPERDHNLAGEKTNSGDMGEFKWRDATDGGYFSFDMTVAADSILQLLQLTYWGSDAGGREFDILVDKVLIASETLTAAKPNHFIEKEYPIPPALLKNKQKVTITLQAHPGKTAGGLFGCRWLKAVDTDR